MRKKRKISFYYLTLVSKNDDLLIKDVFAQVIDHISNLQTQNRKSQFGGTKFGLLEKVTKLDNGERYRIIFKSASHSYRPPLLDSNTVTERENPKRMVEGDRNKTHICCKCVNDNLIIALERYKDSVTINQIIRYLNSHIQSTTIDHSLRFGYEAIVKESFLDEINNLRRIVSADVFIDKQLLGSESLNYSNRINQVQHEVSISVKAKKRDTIINFVRDAFAKIGGGRNDVKRIRVVGRTEDNNEVKINTEFIEKQESVVVNANEDTGEILSDEIMQEIDAILFSIN